MKLRLFTAILLMTSAATLAGMLVGEAINILRDGAPRVFLP